MKLFLIIAAVHALVLTMNAQSGASANALSQDADLRLRAESWREAYNRNDPEGLAAFYTDDAEYVSPHVPGLMIRGRESIRANFQRGVSLGGHIDSIQVLTSGSSCDLGYMVCTYKATNNGAKVTGRNVLVLKKIGGRWLITTHASVVRD